MFAFKKIITPFFLPPGIFIVILIGYGSFLLFFKKRKDGLINIAVGFIFWIFCSVPFSNFLMENLELNYPIPETIKGDVIVLLGGGIIEEVPDLSGSGVPTNEMFARIVTAVRLQRKLTIPIIVSGGKISDKSAAEATIVKRFIVDLGIDESKIILEDKSRDTYENAVFTKKTCEEYAFKSPILVTSAYHMIRSVESFKKVGLNVVPCPANFYALGHGEYNFLSYLPSANGLLIASSAVREYFGLLFYRLIH